MIKETLRASEGLAKVKRITDVKKEMGGEGGGVSEATSSSHGERKK